MQEIEIVITCMQESVKKNNKNYNNNSLFIDEKIKMMI